MSVKERNCFLLYYNFANQFDLLNLEERGMLITAIFQYAKYQSVEIELPTLVQMAFSCIKDVLDRDIESYAAKCKQNTENGKKGGRPRKDIFLPKTEGFFSKPEKPDKDTDTDNDTKFKNDLDIEREKDKDTDKDTDKDIESAAFSCAFATDPVAPQLSEQEEKVLLEKGIPESYLRERKERARLYAKESSKSVFEVLLLWWHSDRAQRPWNQSVAHPKPSAPDDRLDDDDFFNSPLHQAFSMRYLE